VSAHAPGLLAPLARMFLPGMPPRLGIRRNRVRRCAPMASEGRGEAAPSSPSAGESLRRSCGFLRPSAAALRSTRPRGRSCVLVFPVTAGRRRALGTLTTSARCCTRRASGRRRQRIASIRRRLGCQRCNDAGDVLLAPRVAFGQVERFVSCHGLLLRASRRCVTSSWTARTIRAPFAQLLPNPVAGVDEYPC
jgi:hypothetical protein